MVTPDEAAALTCQSARDVYRLVEAGALHFTEGQAGLLICLASLAAGSGDSPWRQPPAPPLKGA